MKNGLKRFLNTTLCLMLALAMVSGGATALAEATEPVTITVFCPNTSAMPMSNDVLMIQVLSEKTNTNFEFVNSPTTGTAEAFNLMMAAGDIPDLVIYTRDPILKYTRAFAPLNDLIDEYCPNYVKLMEKHPSLRKDITAVDGNIYTIQSTAALKFANGVIVRQDWLDKLGLEVPTTLDEYYEVLKAFKEQDPNGNGEADEIPFTVSVARRSDAESPGLSFFDAAWGIDEDFYLSEDGSEILFGAVDPRMKEALEYLNKLYTEGLIDPEYLTRDYASYQGLIADEKAGMWFDWGVGVETALIENPEANLEIILPPVGVDGTLRIFSQMPSARTNAIAISKDSEHKEHIMSIWNYIFSEEGYLLMNFGVEGETYTTEADGSHVYIEAILDDPNGPQTALRNKGVNTWFPLEQSREAEFARTATDKFSNGVALYEPYIVAPVPPLKFTDEEQSTITSMYTGEIKTYMDEALDNFITGRTSLDQFDAFVQQLNNMGLQDILDIYNTALARYNGE